MKLFLVILFLLVLIFNTLSFGYWLGNSTGIDYCINYIKNKYSKCNIFKGLLTNFDKINSTTYKKITTYFILSVISFIVLIVIIIFV